MKFMKCGDRLINPNVIGAMRVDRFERAVRLVITFAGGGATVIEYRKHDDTDANYADAHADMMRLAGLDKED